MFSMSFSKALCLDQQPSAQPILLQSFWSLLSASRASLSTLLLKWSGTRPGTALHSTPTSKAVAMFPWDLRRTHENCCIPCSSGRRVTLPNCKVGSLFGSLFPYGCPHSPHQQQPITVIVAPNLQCSHTQVKVMAPRPSVPPATCLSKPVLLHMIIFGEGVSRLHIFKHLVPNVTNTFPRPLWHVFIFQFAISAHIRHVLQGTESHVGDPLVNHYRSVFFTTGKILVHLHPSLLCPKLLPKPSCLLFQFCCGFESRHAPDDRRLVRVREPTHCTFLHGHSCFFLFASANASSLKISSAFLTPPVSAAFNNSARSPFFHPRHGRLDLPRPILPLVLASRERFNVSRIRSCSTAVAAAVS